MTLDSVLDFLNRGGVLALMMVILIGGHRKWWVFGWQYHEKALEADKWQELAWRSSNNTDKALDIKKGA